MTLEHAGGDAVAELSGAAASASRQRGLTNQLRTCRTKEPAYRRNQQRRPDEMAGLQRLRQTLVDRDSNWGDPRYRLHNQSSPQITTSGFRRSIFHAIHR